MQTDFESNYRQQEPDNQIFLLLICMQYLKWCFFICICVGHLDLW